MFLIQDVLYLIVNSSIYGKKHALNSNEFIKDEFQGEIDVKFFEYLENNWIQTEEGKNVRYELGL